MTYAIISTDFGKSMLEQLERLEFNCDIKLTRYQKILLSEIGTVEQVLSIIVGSPIIVEVVRQDVSNKETVEREVWLKDQDGNKLIYATTKYSRWQIPVLMLEELLTGNIGIGSAIMKYGIATRRKIVELGYDKKTRTLYRVYEIIWNDGRVAFTIRESFSIENFLE